MAWTRLGRETVARALAKIGTRRGLIGTSLAATGLGLAGVTISEEALAGKKRRRRRRRNRGNGGGGSGLGAGNCTVCDGVDNCLFSTIQAAIDAATPGSTITICDDTYNEDITIDKNLTLVGDNPGEVELKGTGTSSVVLVQAGVTATLQGLMITNGAGLPGSAGVSGGGIFNHGQLTVTGCLIEDNEAEFGGAIFNETGARLTIDDTVIQDNKAVAATGNPFAGAIYNRFGAQVTVTNNSRIAENEANNAGAIYNNGVFVINGGTLLTTNTADFDGGAIINDEGNLTIDASSVVGNKAKGKGGGILNFDGQVTIRNNAEVGDNEADLGGGIYVQQPAMLTVIDSAVTGNDADALGGGIFNAGGTVNLQSSTVFENDARVTGGGLFNTEGGVVTLDAQSAVVDNDPNNCIGTNACGA